MKTIHLLLLAATTAIAAGSPTDLSYPPTTSGGHDLNHAPIGQSFTALSTQVRAGLNVADQTTFTNWLSTVYPGQIAPGSYPYGVAPSVTLRIELLAGEGTGGSVLHSETRTLTAPFSGFVDVDYAAAGIRLTVGEKYTLLMTDVSGTTYPQNVTGWVVPSVTDNTPGTGQPIHDSTGATVGYLPNGAYSGGLPILQGALVGNDAGIGDVSFEVIDTTPATPTPPAIITVSGVNATITAYAPRSPGFIVINGGLELNDHLWTTNLNPQNTTFLGGLINWFQTGLLVDYTGTASPQGIILTSLTVKPAASALVLSAADLPDGTVGIPYSSPVTVSGGVPPYTGTVSGLPSGLVFDGLNIAGTATSSSVSTITITIVDATGAAASSSPSLTIKPAPANYTIKDEGTGKINAIGAGFVLVGTKKIVWDSATVIKVNTPKGSISVINSSVTIGQKIQWKGLRDSSTQSVLASKIEIK